MPTVEQIRAARALIGWSQGDLAQQADLSQTGIARIENGTNKPNSQTLAKIQAAFDRADVEFLGDSGVRKRKGEIRTLRGVEGFKSFLDDVYEHAHEKGGEFCLHNAKPENWYTLLGQEWFEMHSKRMAQCKDKIDFKITAEEGSQNLISGSFATYKWFPKELFNEQCIYAFGDTLAFVTFNGEDTIIRVLQDRSFSQGFRILFNIAWEGVAIDIAE